jgi:L-ascorbate metabolism protein UlaG (beta-lactamase superfamily)
VPETPNERRNPLVDLPVDVEALTRVLDAVLLTHPHEDHFDETAADRLPKDVPLVCQPADAEMLKEHGFEDVRPLEGEGWLDGLGVTRTEGRHGRGEMAESLGPVSGFVLAAEGEPTLHMAGDTVWCPEMAAALDAHAPTSSW